MAGTERVIVSLSHGAEDPERVGVAYVTANRGLMMGKQVVMWLTMEAVHLARRGYAESIVVSEKPDPARQHAKFADLGGRFYVCIACWNRRELDDAELLQNAEVQGVEALMNFAGDGALTLSY